jgi:hypothetical protein
MTTKLPPLPIGVAPGSGYWNDWYEKLRTIINNTLLGIAHNSLTGLQGSGPDYFHLTLAQFNTATTPTWIYIKVPTDVVISSASTIFSFTPAAGKTYEIEGQLLLTSASISKAPQPGVSWNTGNTSGVAFVQTTDSLTTTKVANITNGVSARALATSFPDVTNAYPAQIKASLITGTSPAGTFNITLQSS